MLDPGFLALCHGFGVLAELGFVAAEVVLQAFLAARAAEQALVEPLAPAKRETQLAEGIVVGRAMAEGLGLGQRAVEIEEQRAERHGRTRRPRGGVPNDGAPSMPYSR